MRILQSFCMLAYCRMKIRIQYSSGYGIFIAPHLKGPLSLFTSNISSKSFCAQLLHLKCEISKQCMLAYRPNHTRSLSAVWLLQTYLGGLTITTWVVNPQALGRCLKTAYTWWVYRDTNSRQWYFICDQNSITQPPRIVSLHCIFKISE
jgi:hypothetical protein